MFRPIHPGEILREDYMARFGLSVRQLARRLHMPLGQVSGLLAEKRGITVDVALRLGRLFAVDPEMWLILQTDYDLSRAYMCGEAQVTDAVRPLRAGGPAPDRASEPARPRRRRFPLGDLRRLRPRAGGPCRRPRAGVRRRRS